MFKSYYGDPTPFVDENTEVRLSYFDNPPLRALFQPRESFDAIPVNPVLQEFREEYRWILNFEPFMDEWIFWLTDEETIKRAWRGEHLDSTDEYVAHALAVVSKLRALRS